MQLFLTIVAGVVVGFLLFIVAAYLLVKYWIKSKLKALAKSVEGAAKSMVPFTQPLRIRVRRCDDPQWKDGAAVEALAAALTAEGFEEAGIYDIEEIPDVKVLALVEAEKSVFAAICQHPDAGLWVDLVSSYPDGSALTYCTAKPTGLDRPPHKVMERFDPKTPVADLYRQMLEKRPDKPLRPATKENFAANFERAWAEEMDWRVSRGGFTEEEVQRSLKLLGSDATDTQVKQVHTLQQAQVQQWLRIKLKETFQARMKFSESKWTAIGPRLIFIHDRMSDEDVHGMFTGCLNWDDDAAAQKTADATKNMTQGLTARNAFARMAQSLPEEKRLRKLGHISEPVPADIYLGPDGAGGDED